MGSTADNEANDDPVENCSPVGKGPFRLTDPTV